MRVAILSSHSVHFCRVRKLSYFHNFISNLSTYFSVVILEKQPSEKWFWATPKPPSGSTGVWLRLSTVVSLSDQNQKSNDKENCHLSLTKHLSRFEEMSCLQFCLCFTMQQKMKECFSNTNHSIQFIFGLNWMLQLSLDRNVRISDRASSGFNSYSSILVEYFLDLIF